MNTQKERYNNLLVLVPHRDARLVLRGYSAELFKAGFTGAYHFPWVAPLAALPCPLTHEELKKIARTIREAVGKEKFLTTQTMSVGFPSEHDDTLLFGPRLELTGDKKLFEQKLLCPSAVNFTPIIGTCLTEKGETRELPLPPQLSFRAAAVANMNWQPVKGSACGFKWKIGKLFWLPKADKVS